MDNNHAQNDIRLNFLEFKKGKEIAFSRSHCSQLWSPRSVQHFSQLLLMHCYF